MACQSKCAVIQLPSNGASAGDRPTRGIMVANMRLVREAGSNRLPAPASHRSGTDTDRLNKAQRQQPRHRGPTACPDSLRQNRQPQQQDGFTAKTIRERPHSNCAKAKPARNKLKLALMAAAGLQIFLHRGERGQIHIGRQKPSTLKPPSQTKNPFLVALFLLRRQVYVGAECRECKAACETLIFGGCIQKFAG